jgi:hypothetical protein
VAIPDEVWLPLPAYEGLYEVSDYGRVRSVDRTVPYRGGKSRKLSGRALKQQPSTHDYPAVSLCRDGSYRSFAIHILVARAFIGQPADGEEVRHRNGDRSNPTLSNLCYGTRTDNMQDAADHGTLARGEKNGHARLNEADVKHIRTMQGIVSARSLAELFGVTRGTIYAIQGHKRWRHV